MVHHKGVVALVSVLIISASAWLMLIGQTVLQLNQVFISESDGKGGRALVLAQGCLDLAKRAVILKSNYKGQSLSLDGQSCIINVNRDRDFYQFEVTAIVGSYNKKISAEALMINGELAISNWQQSE